MSKICPNCKFENSDEAEFCQNCGNKIKRFLSINPPKMYQRGLQV